METFLTLDDLLLPPALASGVSVLLLAGLVHLGRWSATRLGFHPNRFIPTATAFVGVAGVLAAALHGAALAGVLQLGWLRVLGAVLMIFGIRELVRRARTLRPTSRHAFEIFGAARGGERIALAVSWAVIGLTCAAALGPPTDIDSLNYHLGVSLDWIRRGQGFAHPEWLSARLVGSGEMLSLLGLAVGTDTFSSTLQAAGLVSLGAAAASVAATPGARVLAWLLVAGAPQVVTLALTQKPQLLPSVAVTLAILLAADRRTPLSTAKAVLAGSAIAFAVGCKYTFLFPAIVASGVLLLVAWAEKRLLPTVAAMTTCALLLAGPLYLRNWLFYGDPLSPFLEFVKVSPDPVVVAFGEHLANTGFSRSVGDLIRFPFRLIGFRPPSEIPAILGLGLLAPAFVCMRRLRQTVDARLLLASAIAVSLLILLGGRLSSRDFLEVYLLAGCASVAAPRMGVIAQGWRLVLLGQAVVVLGMVGYAATRMFPAAVSGTARDAYMREAADEYVAVHWLRGVAPAHATLMAELRAVVLIDRPFISWEYARFLATAALPEAEKTRRLQQLATCRGVTHVAMRWPTDESALAALAEQAPLTSGPHSFEWTARNPWSRGGDYALVLRELIGRPRGRDDCVP